MSNFIRNLTYVIVISSILNIIFNSGKLDKEKLKNYKPEKYFDNEQLKLLFDPYPKSINEKNHESKSLNRLENIYDSICSYNYKGYVLKKIDEIEKESPRHVLTYTINTISTENKRLDKNFNPNPLLRKTCEYYEKMDFNNHLYHVKAKEIVSSQNYLIQFTWYSFQFINFSIIFVFDHLYFFFLFMSLIPQLALESVIDYFQF